MQLPLLTISDYDAVRMYVNEHAIALLILDFNGVLDDYYTQKIIFLRSVLEEHQARYLPELLLTIERAYMTDRSATVEQSVERFFAATDMPITGVQRNMLTRHKITSQLTGKAKAFLDSLEVPFVIYTALSRDQAEQSLGTSRYDLFTRDQYQEDKPSIENLRVIMERYGVAPEQTCVVGDGLIDDCMPAALIGAHTILVSPYANVLVHPSAA